MYPGITISIYLYECPGCLAEPFTSHKYQPSSSLTHSLGNHNWSWGRGQQQAMVCPTRPKKTGGFSHSGFSDTQKPNPCNEPPPLPHSTSWRTSPGFLGERRVVGRGCGGTPSIRGGVGDTPKSFSSFFSNQRPYKKRAVLRGRGNLTPFG